MKTQVFLVLFVLGLLAPVASRGEGKFVGASSPLAAPLVLRWMEDLQAARPGSRTTLRTRPAQKALDLWRARKALFAAVESPLTPEEQKDLLAWSPFQLPVAIGAAAVVYNAPGVPDGLKLSPGLLSRIFNGEVGNWNHPHIAQMNQGTTLPPMPIRVIAREAGPRDLFPALLAGRDADRIGKTRGDGLLDWAVGSTVKGDGEALRSLREWAGGIALVDASFVLTQGLPSAAVMNQAGRYIQPSPASLAAAASDIVRLPANFQVALSGSIAPEAYPLSSFLWMMLYQDAAKAYKDRGKASALAEFLRFVLTQGQEKAGSLGFAPLPERLRVQVLERAGGIKF